MAADLDHLHPTFRQRIEKACAVTGASILSAARSRERQAELFAAFLNGTGNSANPPGTSWHEFGDGLPGTGSALAVDFLTGGRADRALAEVRARAEEFQLCFPIKGEAWHAQPIEVADAKRVPRVPALFTMPQPEEQLPMEFTYIVEGQDWLWLGAERIHTRCASPDVLEGLKKGNQIVGMGDRGKQFHEFLKSVAENAKFTTG